MAKYYYDKHELGSVRKFRDDCPLETLGYGGTIVFTSLYKSYTFNPNTNTWTMYTPFTAIDFIATNTRGYKLDGNGNILIYASKNSNSQYASDPIENDMYYKNSSRNSFFYEDVKGPLNKTDIIAEDGTYPTNGKHTDGFWYVRKTAVPVPSIPTVFTAPVGDVEIGDTRSFVVGASTISDGTITKYVWEASVNGGNYTNVGESTSPSFSYTIPTATSLKMRVKAISSLGSESGYRESNSFVVTKPKYYFSKFNALSLYPIVYDPPSTRELDNTILSDVQYSFRVSPILDIAYSEVGYNPSTGFFTGYIKIYNTSVVNVSTAYADGNRNILYISNDATTLHHFTLNSYLNGKCSITYKKGYKSPTLVYSKGTLVQSGIIALEDAYPQNGRHSDGFWYERGSRVNQSIDPPKPFTAPEGSVLKKNTVATIVFGASSAANVTYEVDYRYNQDAWASLGVNSDLTRQLTITTDKSKQTVEFRVRAKNTSNVYSDYIYSNVFTVEHNVIPTLLLNTVDNQTLYENSTFIIDGSANDTDDDQSLTAYYQINDTSRKVIGVGVSKTPVVFSKQLVFKSGKLFDGETAITEALAEGVAHTLKVFAIDSEGGLSKEEIRSFHVVPNRAPALTVNPIDSSSCSIDHDSFIVSGTCSDPDSNDVVVTYRINSGLSTEIHRGTGGNWSFNLSLKNLVEGENTVVIEVVDSYNAKVSKTIKLNKTVNKTPLLSSVVRYKIVPPNNKSSGVLLWVQRDEGLTMDAELSMTLNNEQEDFVSMELTNTAPVSPGVVEDEFYLKGSEAKENFIIKLNMTRASLDVSDKITMISGVLE